MAKYNPFLHTKTNDSVATPPELLADIVRIFNIDFDPAPLDHSFDGLTVNWGSSNYVNPPFSDIATWLQRALSVPGQSVFLIPYRATSKYWRELVWPNADGIYFFTQSIIFSGYTNPFAAPMVLIVFHRPDHMPLPLIDSLGGYSVVRMTR